MPIWPFGRRKPAARDGTAVLSAGPASDGPRGTRSRRRRKRPRTALSDTVEQHHPPLRASDDITALPRHELPRLSSKKNDASLVRRKSSKKREHDHVREEEIRAMSMPLPQKRRAVNSGGMLRRDSKKVKSAPNYRSERPTSNVSVALEDSVRSSMSSGSESRAFRVSTLDMFTPRPTIRFSIGSQTHSGGAGSSPNSDQEKSPNKRERRATFDKHNYEDKRSSRIDDLADTLDAGALREIMDRDKRRKDKKRKADEERLRHRLERRAEKQKAAEEGISPPRESHGVVGLGIDKDIAVSTPPHRPLTPMDDVRPSTPQRQPSKIEIPPAATNTVEDSQLPTPLESPFEDPVVSDAKAVRYSRGSVSSPTHMRGPSNISQMPALLSEVAARVMAAQDARASDPKQDPNRSGSLHPVISTDTSSTSKKAFGRRRSSEGRRMSAFASFFRRGKRTSQDVVGGRTTPSEASFSNTSRESMSRQPLPPHLVAAVPPGPIQIIRRPSGAVHRSGSKFREDLPEFPLSPPDSRVQSPESKTASAIAARRQSHAPRDVHVEPDSPHRTDSPVSPGVPASGIMSQSLASVDSEGSWLSGKPLKRQSNKSHMRSSVGSSTLKRNEEFNASYEELGIPDDEYFKRLTPGPEGRQGSASSTHALAKKASSTVMAANDTTPEYDDGEGGMSERRSEDKENLVKNVIGRQPTIVHHQTRVKSTEGLLSCYTDAADPLSQGAPPPDSSTPEQESPSAVESPTSDGESAKLQRAKSVDLGKNHVRHLSAGSAKLLDIQKRSSVGSHTKL